MQELIRLIRNLEKSEIKRVIDARLKEFENAQDLFNELSFCLLTANFNADRSIKIQSAIGTGFLTLTEKALAKKLKELGHRYPNARAKYIAEARKHKYKLQKTGNEQEYREWLVQNVKGMGYKEASHFLRNIGYKNSAIIDFHIIDLLEKHNLAERPKTLTRKNYLEIESKLKNLAEETETSLAELDLYLWYLETGKILK